MNNPGPNAINTTPQSLIEGMIAGDLVQWERFCETYRPWLVYKARMLMRGEHPQDVEDVVQDVIQTLFVQKSQHGLTYRTSKGKWRSYLNSCVHHAYFSRIKQRKRIDKMNQSLRDSVDDREPAVAADDPEEEVKYHLSLLAVAMREVRGHWASRNPIKWKCFEGRFLHRRPSLELAEEMEISTNQVDQNSSRIFKELAALCRSRYETDFASQGFGDSIQQHATNSIHELQQSGLWCNVEEDPTELKNRLSLFLRSVLSRVLPAICARTPVPVWNEFTKYVLEFRESGECTAVSEALQNLIQTIESRCQRECRTDDSDFMNFRALKKLDPNVVIEQCGRILSEEQLHAHD